MKRHALIPLILFAAWSFGVFSSPVAAQLTIRVSGGVEAAQPIAVVPFGVTEGLIPPVDAAGLIAADLARTGRFKPLANSEMLNLPSRRDEIDARDWNLLGVNNVVIGRVEQIATGYRLSYDLYDVRRAESLASGVRDSGPNGLRRAAHQIADTIYEKLTGQRGVATTRIAYVATSGSGERQKVALRVADADGANAQTIVSSAEPIMSPAWSPNGRRIAYVSFENRRAAVYVQDIDSGHRDLVASYPGLNSAPAFSPDGARLALVLSKDGNPEIYTLNLLSRELVRLTNHFAIDTEPAFSPDGQSIVFTSDRGGSPQIYRMPAAGGPARRMTAQGSYNAHARYAPDGQSLTLVTRTDGGFRIALLDLNQGAMRLLSPGHLDEAPSFAPNGAMVIYAATRSGRGVLAATAVDGEVTQRLAQDSGQVREPAWSPFIE